MKPAGRDHNARMAERSPLGAFSDAIEYLDLEGARQAQSAAALCGEVLSPQTLGDAFARVREPCDPHEDSAEWDAHVAIMDSIADLCLPAERARASTHAYGYQTDAPGHPQDSASRRRELRD